jgi:hypothetical protein
MMRRKTISPLDFYRPEALHIEDYDLWARAAPVTKIANLPEVLYIYRAWCGNICSRFSKTQEKKITRIIMPLMMQRLLGYNVPHDTLVALRQISMDAPLKDRFQTKKVGKLIRDIHHAYLKKTSLTAAQAKRVSKDAGKRLYTLASFASRSSIWQGLPLYVHAVRLNPQLFSLQFMKKLIRGLAHHPVKVPR